jgi:hypothetical protein
VLYSEDWINCNPLILQYPKQPVCHIPGQLRFSADNSPWLIRVEILAASRVNRRSSINRRAALVPARTVLMKTGGSGSIVFGVRLGADGHPEETVGLRA